MIGILTEKPSAARNFAAALGGQSGTYHGENYLIVAARGHLYEYADPSEQVPDAYRDQYHSWRVENLPWDETLFSWKRVKKKDVSSTLTAIKNALAGCSEVVIATDVDPTGEGELLAWEILDELHIRKKIFSRMYFVDESAKELQKAFVNRKLLPAMEKDMDFVKARYRSQWDMLSMQFTRIATSCANNMVIRQGRLKSVMVKLVGEQLAAIAAYKKVPFYVNKFRDENGVVYTNPDEPRFLSKAQVPQMYHSSSVVKDGVTRKHQVPPRLMDLSALSSRLAASGYKAKEVLDVYQKMYEAQVVSYPRTEDKVITPEQFNDLLPKVDAIAKVVGVDLSYLTHRTPRSTHVKTGGAHGANRPGPNVPSSLASLQQYGACAPLIYDILAKNYLAMLAEDYEYDTEKGHVSDYPTFVGTVSVPKVMGWKQVFSDDDSTDENGVGIGTMADPFVYEGVNPKPETPTMKWLMKQLEKYDVGTGATRASTYADVTNDRTKYPLLIDKKGKLSMADCGEASYLLLEGTYIGDAKMTEALMQEMRDIADGKLDPAACLHKVQDYVRHDLQVMQNNKDKLPKEMQKMSETKYPEKEKFTGTWNGKSVSFNRQWSTHRFTDKECADLCAGKEIVISDLISKKGTPYSIHGKLAVQDFNGHEFVGFKNLGFVDSFPKQWCGHEFTEDEQIMLEKGHEVFIEGCVSKKGSAFSCYVSYEEKDGKKMIVPNWNKK